jgi:hypothetical protein
MSNFHHIFHRTARTFTLLAGATAALSAGTAHAAAQSAVSKAVIVRPYVFINAQDLDFGSVIPSGTAGTVVVPPDGPRTATGGATIVGSSPYTPARFAGEGTEGQQVNIIFSSSSTTLTRAGGTETMTVDNFTLGASPSFTPGAGPDLYVIDSTTGIFNFPVGATLQVGANQADGVYEGSFQMELTYQ